VPDAVTFERIHSLRAIGLPVFMVALAVPALAFLAERSSSSVWRAAAGAVLVAGVAQLAIFQIDFWRDGPKRGDAFQAAFPRVFRAAATAGPPIIIYRNDYEALGNGQWYGKLWRIPVRFVPAGTEAPRGSVVVTGLERCATCRTISRGGVFRAYITAP
jgi:hypothetical protein